MKNYIVKRLLLIPFTLLGILALNFIIIQFAPGGPVEHVLAKYQGMNVDAKGQFSGNVNMASTTNSRYQGARGIPDEMIKELEKQFGFDKPASYRFLKMIADYATFNFGKSFYQDKTVAQLIMQYALRIIAYNIFLQLFLVLLTIILLKNKKTWVKLLSILPLIYVIITTSIYVYQINMSSYFFPSALIPDYFLYGYLMGILMFAFTYTFDNYLDTLLSDREEEAELFREEFF